MSKQHSTAQALIQHSTKGHQSYPITSQTDPYSQELYVEEESYDELSSPSNQHAFVKNLDDFLKDDADEIEDLGVHPSNNVMQEELLQFERQYQLQQQVTAILKVGGSGSNNPPPSIIDEQKTPKNIIRYHKKQPNRGQVEQSNECVNIMSLSSNSMVPKSPNAQLQIAGQKSDNTPKVVGSIQLGVIHLEKHGSSNPPLLTPLQVAGELEHQDTIVRQTSTQSSHLAIAQAYSSFNSDVKIPILNPTLLSQPSFAQNPSNDPVLSILNKALSYFSSTDLPTIQIPQFQQSKIPIVNEPSSFIEEPTMIQDQQQQQQSKITMSEAMISQFKRENDQLRKEVNQLHEKLFKIKGQNKLLKQNSGRSVGEIESQMAQLTKLYQKEKSEKESLMRMLNDQAQRSELLSGGGDTKMIRGSIENIISMTKQQPIKNRKKHQNVQQSMNQEQVINSLQQALVQRDQEILYYKHQIPGKQQNSYMASAFKNNQSIQSDIPLTQIQAEENVLDEFDDEEDDQDDYDEEIINQQELQLQQKHEDIFYNHQQSGIISHPCHGRIGSHSGKNSQLYLYTRINSTSTELTPYKVLMTQPGNNNGQLQMSYGNIQQNPINTTKAILTTDQFSDHHPNYGGSGVINGSKNLSAHSMSQTRSHGNGTASKRSYGGGGPLSQSALGTGHGGISTPMVVHQHNQQFYSYEKRPHSPNHNLTGQVPRGNHSMLQSANGGGYSNHNYALDKPQSPSVAVGVFRTQNPVIMNPPQKMPIQQNLQLSSQQPSRVNNLKQVQAHQSTYSSQQSLQGPIQQQRPQQRQPLKATHQPPTQLNSSMQTSAAFNQRNAIHTANNSQHYKNYKVSGGTPNATHSLAFQVNTQYSNGSQRLGSIEARQAQFAGGGVLPGGGGRNQVMQHNSYHQHQQQMHKQQIQHHPRPMRTVDDIYQGGNSQHQQQVMSMYEEDDEFGMGGQRQGNNGSSEFIDEEDLEELG